MKRVFLLGFFLVVVAHPAHAQFTFTSLDFPAGTLTTARGINNQGEIVGAYRITPPRHALLIRAGNYIPLAPTTILGTNYSEAFKSNDRGDVVGEIIGDDGFFHGFLFSDGVVTTLDFPGATQTQVLGINESGTVVGEGDFFDANGNLLSYHGFTWKNGAFSEVDVPGSADTSVVGINAAGDLVGLWDTGVSSPIGHGFLFSNGQFTSFDVPVAGATVTQPDDINASGQIVGLYVDAAGAIHGFLMAGATFTTLDFPGAAQTSAWGINSAGQIVGTYRTVPGEPPHGFLAEPGNKAKGLAALAAAAGQFTSFDFPGAINTQATAITPSGDIVGRYFSADGREHGFLKSGGNFTSIDVPGAKTFTDLTWINPQGQIVGSYDSADGKTHAYLLSGGTFTTIDDPGAQTTIGFGIGANGDILGLEITNGILHGYLLDKSTGNFSLIDFPGAQGTLPTMEAAGRIVGGYFDTSGLHGFLLTGGNFQSINCPGTVGMFLSGIDPLGRMVGGSTNADGSSQGVLVNDGNCLSIQFPGGNSTYANGINAEGTIVGRYISADGKTHGFVLANAH